MSWLCYGLAGMTIVSCPTHTYTCIKAVCPLHFTLLLPVWCLLLAKSACVVWATHVAHKICPLLWNVTTTWMDIMNFELTWAQTYLFTQKITSYHTDYNGLTQFVSQSVMISIFQNVPAYLRAPICLCPAPSCGKLVWIIKMNLIWKIWLPYHPGHVTPAWLCYAIVAPLIGHQHVSCFSVTWLAWSDADELFKLYVSTPLSTKAKAILHCLWRFLMTCCTLYIYGHKIKLHFYKYLMYKEKAGWYSYLLTNAFSISRT